MLDWGVRLGSFVVFAAACGADAPSVVPGGEQVATTDAVYAFAADDDVIAWTTAVGSTTDPLESVWRLDPGAAPVELFTGAFSQIGATGHLVLASHQAYWEQLFEFTQIFTTDSDHAVETALGGPSVALLAGDGPYLARTQNATDLDVADPRTSADRAAWEGHYPVAGMLVAIGAGKLVLARKGYAQTIALGTGDIADFDLGQREPTTIVPADDGFFLVDTSGALFHITAATGATYLAELPIDPARTYAAVGNDLWFTLNGTEDPRSISILTHVHPDGTRDEQPVLANAIQIGRGGSTLVVVTRDGVSSTLWRVRP
jgi:hypothetical protein